MKPVRIAQIGSGHDHASMTFRSLLGQPDCFDVIGFAPTDRTASVPELYNAVPRFTIQQLLEMKELEAVAVECEEREATAIAQLFAQRGVAVHMDKPGSQDLPAFERLIDTVVRHKTPFHMGYMYRYNPSVRHLFELVQSGELGDIYSVEAQMSCRHPRHKRQWLAQFQGGMMFYLGCHLVDLVLRLQGEPLEILPMNVATGIEDVTAEDFGFAVLRYANGVSFVKTCACEENGYARRQLVVCGSKGSYEIKPFEVPQSTSSELISPTRVSFTKNNPNCKWTNLSEELDFGAYDRYDDMMRTFADIVRGAENAYTPEYELLLFRTVMQCCGVSQE